MKRVHFTPQRLYSMVRARDGGTNAPVAQLDRASASGAEGQGFESLRARH